MSPLEGLQLIGQRHRALTPSRAPGLIDSLVGESARRRADVIGNLAAIYSPRQRGRAAVQGRHALGRFPFRRSPRDRMTGTKLPSYEYFNFGAGYAVPNAGVRINVDLLNAFQSKGLEEGNPRLVAPGGIRSSSPGRFCRAGCRRRSSTISEAAGSNASAKRPLPAPAAGHLAAAGLLQEHGMRATATLLAALWRTPALLGPRLRGPATRHPRLHIPPHHRRSPPLALAVHRQRPPGRRHSAARHRRLGLLPGRALRARAGRRAAHRRHSGMECHRRIRRQPLDRHEARAGQRGARRIGRLVDMRTGTARTSYAWVNGGAATSVRIETFVSRADPPSRRSGWI